MRKDRAGRHWVCGQTGQLPLEPLLRSLLQRPLSSSLMKTGRPKTASLTIQALGTG